MRHLKTLAIGLSLLPAAAMAQTHVKAEFEQFIAHPKVEVQEDHAMEKDPKTGEKESQSDIYTFALSKKHEQLVKTLERAFVLDADEAYKFANGTRTKDSQPVALAVGGETGNGVIIGSRSGMKYTYACFIAPEDTAGNHRYAYALEWQPTAGGDFITGKLVVTYATTQHYRQERQQAVAVTDFGTISRELLKGFDTTLQDSIMARFDDIDFGSAKRFGNGVTIYSKTTWIEKLNTYIMAMSNNNNVLMRRAVAGKIYSHTKDAKGADARDKSTARELLNALLEESVIDKDNITRELINGALMNIK